MSEKNESDQNFNDAELRDIMSEIESLEKEFVDEESDDTNTDEVVNELDSAEETPEESEVEASTKTEDETSNEDDIVSEADIESISQEMVTSEENTTPNEEDNVTELHVYKEESTSIATKTSAPTSEISPGEMSFSGSGKLDLNLSFYIGDRQATLKVVDGVGLSVDLDGTTLKFDSNGCHVDIEGGANINLPLSSSSSAKKAA